MYGFRYVPFILDMYKDGISFMEVNVKLVDYGDENNESLDGFSRCINELYCCHYASACVLLL